MHDGAPAPFSRAVRDVLNNTYHDRKTGRGGPTAWLPLSPDFNHLDLYVWGHLKTFVSAAPFDNEDAFRCHIVGTWQTIPSTPASLKECSSP
jgi:hypothetical protein